MYYSKPINCIIIGLGEIGRKHVKALGCIEGFRLVAVCDPISDFSDLAGNIRTYRDTERALKTECVKLIIVATPPNATQRIISDCRNFSGHLLVEKPGALAQVAITQLARFRVAPRCFVAFQTHFAHGIKKLLTHKQLLIDESTSFWIDLNWRRDDAYFDSWRAKRSEFGGILFQHVIHSLALVDRLIPDDDIAIHFECVSQCERPWKETEDFLSVTIRFVSGRFIRIKASISANNSADHHSLLIKRSGKAPIFISGRNLELGINEAGRVLPAEFSSDVLRLRMLRAIRALILGETIDTRLYTVSRLARLLQLIEAAYAADKAKGALQKSAQRSPVTLSASSRRALHRLSCADSELVSARHSSHPGDTERHIESKAQFRSASQ